jgi:hypothetical protein
MPIIVPRLDACTANIRKLRAMFGLLIRRSKRNQSASNAFGLNPRTAFTLK